MDMRPYSSFLLRCWDLGRTGERVEIEHIQTHNSTSLHSITDAVEWIRTVHRGDETHRRHTDHRHADTAHQKPGDHPTEGEFT